jgi:hypothetical protein
MHDIIESLKANDIAPGSMGGLGIVLLLLALKVGKGTAKAGIVFGALALLAAAVWWHWHYRH